MQSYNILALHGFLGAPDDWQGIEQALADKTGLEANWIKPDLFSSSEISEQDLTSFAAISEKIVGLVPLQQRTVFIGYSLGARIGLHLLENYSDRFKAFIFLSAHPGLQSDAEKDLRKKNDLSWNEKLLTQPWNKFWSEWTSQPVFVADKAFSRNPDEFNLQKLSKGLTSLSLANQSSKEAVIEKHRDKVIWVIGDKDLKFSAMAEELKQKKILSGYERIFDSGHRVLFDQPSTVADIIYSIN